MAKPNSAETQQQHTERMKRWGVENLAALKAGKLRTSRNLPELRTTIVSSSDKPAPPTSEAK